MMASYGVATGCTKAIVGGGTHMNSTTLAHFLCRYISKVDNYNENTRTMGICHDWKCRNHLEAKREALELAINGDDDVNAAKLHLQQHRSWEEKPPLLCA
jgi:hypothetical protein